MVVLSDESYEILRQYQKEEKIANLDTALDNLVEEIKPKVEGSGTFMRVM